MDESGGDPAEQRGHRLAAALLYTLIGTTHGTVDVIIDLAWELRNSARTDDITDQAAAAANGPPATIAEIAVLVEATEGVHYTNLITALTDPVTADHTLTQILHTATNLDPDQQPDSDIE